MKVACVLVTHLRAKVELRRQPHLQATPAVIVDRSGGRPVVVDALPAAAGVTAGMTLEEALSHHTNTTVLEADESAYQRVYQQVLTSLQGVSDRVEGPEPGTAYIRLDGLEELYGGEPRLVSALLNSVPEYLGPRVGVGHAKFPAFVAARTSTAHGAARVPADAAAFLAPHPVDLLPLPAAVVAAMRRLGLRTMGDAAAVGADLLTDQFGRAGRRAWELCRGVDDSPLVPLKHEESITEHAALPFSSASLELLATTVDTLLRRAYSRPRMEGRRAGRADLECVLSGALPWRRTVHFKGGAESWERASRVIRGRLEADHPRAPVEEVTLTLAGITGGLGVQMGLLPDIREGQERRLLEAERELQARAGGGHALYRMAQVAPWHPAPEMRAVQVPIDPSGKDAMKPLSTPAAVAVREGPDRQPAAVRLGERWRRVARIEDRWCFDLWWLPEPLTRTYYRVSAEDGRQVTLFRDQRGGRWYRQTP